MPEKKSKQQAKKKPVKAIVNIRVFQPEIIKIRNIVLKIYKPVDSETRLEEITVYTSRDVIDALNERIERMKKKLARELPKGLIDIQIEGKGFALHLGDYTEETEEKRILIFPRPSRLMRLGVLRTSQEEVKVEWIKKSFRNELYVYEGFLEIPKGIDAVVLETENGTRVLKNLVE